MTHWIKFLAALAACTWLAASAAAQSNPSARITTPISDQTVRGSVAIQGTAKSDAFTRYEIAYAAEPDLASWTVIGGAVQPVEDNLLAVWNTRPLPDGAYALRVQVFNSDGSVLEGFVRNVKVANAVATPLPAVVTETGAGNETASQVSGADTAAAASAQEFDLASIPAAFVRGGRIALLAFAGLGAYVLFKIAGWAFRRWFAKPVDYGK